MVTFWVPNLQSQLNLTWSSYRFRKDMGFAEVAARNALEACNGFLLCMGHSCDRDI